MGARSLTGDRSLPSVFGNGSGGMIQIIRREHCTQLVGCSPASPFIPHAGRQRGRTVHHAMNTAAVSRTEEVLAPIMRRLIERAPSMVRFVEAEESFNEWLVWETLDAIKREGMVARRDVTFFTPLVVGSRASGGVTAVDVAACTVATEALWKRHLYGQSGLLDRGFGIDVRRLHVLVLVGDRVALRSWNAQLQATRWDVRHARCVDAPAPRAGGMLVRILAWCDYGGRQSLY